MLAMPEDDGAGGLELRDDRGVLRRDELVARAREAVPAGRGDVALEAGVGLDDDRHAPERAARAAPCGPASCRAASASASSRNSVSIAP